MRLFELINENSFLIAGAILLAVSGFLSWKFIPFNLRLLVIVITVVVLAGTFYLNKADLTNQQTIDATEQIFQGNTPVLVELYSDF